MGMLDGKVAVVTGAGGGLGRAHALLLAQEGASVVVNDLGGSRDGTGAGSSMADTVVEEIKAAGGNAIANYGSVTSREDAEAMVQAAVDAFGQIDILIANAGILRDKSFKNMDDGMWDAVIDVHLRGTYLNIVIASRPDDLMPVFARLRKGAKKVRRFGTPDLCSTQQLMMQSVRHRAEIH